MPDPRDTIFALSSGRPPAAIAVVRVSGPRARDAITALAGRVPQPRRATLLRLGSPGRNGSGRGVGQWASESADFPAGREFGREIFADRASRRRVPQGAAADSAFEPIDDALVLWFPGPRSETGEDTAEFQLHGGLAVVAAVLAALADVEGLRPAGPGGFTRRAFEEGKIDLTRGGGVGGLIGGGNADKRGAAVRRRTERPGG